MKNLIMASIHICIHMYDLAFEFMLLQVNDWLSLPLGSDFQPPVIHHPKRILTVTLPYCRSPEGTMGLGLVARSHGSQ
jgi:hypothetical protein